jgi:uncharacterized membrane protein YfcA
LGLLFVLIVGLLAGTISGIVGTGSSIMLMPVLIYKYGPKQAVPIMAVAAVLANVSRILAWWRKVDWRACAAQSSLMFGAFIAKRFVLHLKPDAFRLVMDAIMIAAGLSMLWDATQSP